MIIRKYDIALHKPKILPNQWDILSLFLIFSLFIILAWGAVQMTTPYHIGEKLVISLHPSNLPHYAIRTILRMLFALFFSFIFTFAVGIWAAKSKKAESIIIPFIDILQAVPVLSFLSITVVAFITLFPGSLLGPECASIFAVFTAQAWNMVLGFYQSVKSIPHDLKEAAAMFHLSAWQRFWRIEVPFSMSSLLWNTMMSMSASWFYVVATEAITVSQQDIKLPGIGSYIAVAIEQSNFTAIGYAIITMLIVIFIYDQIFFRPLIKWSEKFRSEPSLNEKGTRSWVIYLLQKSKLLRYAKHLFLPLSDKIINATIFNKKLTFKRNFKLHIPFSLSWLWPLLIMTILLGSSFVMFHYILTALSLNEIFVVTKLGCITAIRVVILLIISSLIWVPIGVWIGMKPTLTQTVQPIVQFLASFPANLLFPLVVFLILKYQLNINIWTTPLMILGSQWYILFNVIAGTASLPKDLYHATTNFGLKGFQWWFKFILPGIFPFFITGAITAAGGAWNASIVAEWVTYGDTTLVADGLGAYIAEYTALGDFHRITLGTAMMCIFVLIFNKALWQPLYRLAQERFKLLE